MTGITTEQAVHALEENVTQTLRLGEWRIYEHYHCDVIDAAGNRCIKARGASGPNNKVRQRSRPLSRVSADLFLTFARWVEDEDMDEELDSETNVKAAKAWAETFGLLGLNPNGETLLSSKMSSRRVTAHYLDMPWLLEAGGERRYSDTGPERVWDFAFEAWEAYTVLRLYESVRSQGALNAPSPIEFMSTFDEGGPQHMGSAWVERDVYSQEPALSRRWALTIVEDAVNRKIRNHCYPIIQGEPGSYEQSWGFNSLLGAMWLQMLFIMRADRKCRYCNKALDPSMRSHAKFCPNDGKCKAKWHKDQKNQREARRYGAAT